MMMNEWFNRPRLTNTRMHVARRFKVPRELGIGQFAFDKPQGFDRPHYYGRRQSLSNATAKVDDSSASLTHALVRSKP